MAESWTGPKLDAEFNADRLGYPVLINGLRCDKKLEALNAIARGGDEVEVERYDPGEVLLEQETSGVEESGQEGQG